MDRKVLVMLLCLCCLFGCRQTVFINPDGENPTTVRTTQDEVTVQKTTPPSVVPAQVRVLFNMQTTFPSGMISPDVVYMNGNPIQENTFVAPGLYTFVIEKRGYTKKMEEIEVKDADGDGTFSLALTLEPKERVVIFDIRDQATDQVVLPDQVLVSSLPVGTSKSLSDRSPVLPGKKKVVIQKQGYEPLSQDITIDPDEDPYILRHNLVPIK